MPKINWSMVATLVVAAAVVFVLQKYLTRVKIDPATGNKKLFIGFEGTQFEI